MESRYSLIGLLLAVFLFLPIAWSGAQSIRCIPGLNCPEDRPVPPATNPPPPPAATPTTPPAQPPRPTPSPEAGSDPRQPVVRTNPSTRSPAISNQTTGRSGETPICPAAGTRIAYEGTQRTLTWAGAEQDPLYCVSQRSNEDRQRKTLWLIWSLDSASTRDNLLTVQSALRRLFPLRDGSHTNFDWIDRSQVWNNNIKVIGSDSLTVGQQRREVWIVERINRGSINNHHHSIETRWIDKETGAPLKLRIELKSGTTNNSEYTASSITIPQR